MDHVDEENGSLSYLPASHIQGEIFIKNDEVLFKMMRFAFKMMSFLLKMMGFPFKMMKFVFKRAETPRRQLDQRFLIIMMNFAFK